MCVFHLDNATEIVEHQTTKVSYHEALDVHIIHIERDAIVLAIDELNRAQKMKAADEVFPDTANQPVQWIYSIRINHGVTLNVDETIVVWIQALKVRLITMAVIKDVVIEKIGILLIWNIDWNIFRKIWLSINLIYRNNSRSTSRSPSEGRSRIWSSELAKHLQFDLVDTAGMTEDQLREIPYTVVETQSAKSRNSNNSSVKVHKNHAKDRVDRIRG